MKMKKTQLVMDTRDPVTKEEAADNLWKLKLKKEEIETEYKVWDKYLKSHMTPGEKVVGETVTIAYIETTKLEVAIAALKATYPDTYEECLRVVMDIAEKKYGRDNLEKIGTKIPYQKRFDFTPREVM